LRILRVTIGIWLVGMMTAVSMGQATVDDPQAVVLAAFERLETYTFTSQLTSHSIYTNEAGESTEVVSLSTLDGNVLANGDRQTTLKQFSGETIVDAFGSRAMIVDQLVIGDETYVNIGNVEYMEIIEPGWWRYEDLKAQFESVSTGVVVDQALQSAVPHEYLPAVDYIKTVTEQPGEEVDGVAMRVFDVEVDVMQMRLDEIPGTTEEREAELEKNADLIEVMAFSSVYRLWLRAEDGLLLQGTVTSHSLLPYLTAGGDDAVVNFDIETTSAGEFEITSYDETVEFTAPEVNDLP
jgi:hypothetical protein